MSVAHNVQTLVFGVGPQDDPEGGWVGCEVCLDMLKELPSGQGILAAGAGMNNERMLLLVATLKEQQLFRHRATILPDDTCPSYDMSSEYLHAR